MGAWFWICVVAIPVAFGVLGDMHKRHMKVKERELELKSGSLANDSDVMKAQMQRIEDRVRTLERIVTDKGYDLAEEIDRLERRSH